MNETSELSTTVTQSWKRFFEIYEPLRPALYTPVVIVELCGELDLPCRTNGTFRARGDA